MSSSDVERILSMCWGIPKSPKLSGFASELWGALERKEGQQAIVTLLGKFPVGRDETPLDNTPAEQIYGHLRKLVQP